jgi:hypothetical protein
VCTPTSISRHAQREEEAVLSQREEEAVLSPTVMDASVLAHVSLFSQGDATLSRKMVARSGRHF